MTVDRVRTIGVTGATGLQGGAVTRQMLSSGWRVRALTRNPQSEKAQGIAAPGAEVVQVTVLRPMAFMELMTEKKFFPAVSTWHVMPKLMGSSREVGWLCADDLGFIAAKAFAEPDRFIGKELRLASDIQTIDECRIIYRRVMGKSPPL